MSLERDEGVAAALSATPMQHATQNKAIDTNRLSECIQLCGTVLVNRRGITTSGLALGNSSLCRSAQLAVLRQLGDGRED